MIPDTRKRELSPAARDLASMTAADPTTLVPTAMTRLGEKGSPTAEMRPYDETRLRRPTAAEQRAMDKDTARTLRRGIGVSPLENAIERLHEVLEGAASVATGGLLSRRTLGVPERAEYEETAAGTVGRIAGSVLPGALAERAAATALRSAPRLLRNIGRFGAGGAAGEAALEAEQIVSGRNEQTAGERLGDIALGAGLSAGIGVAAPYAGRMIRSAIDRLRNRGQAQEVLALPPPRERGNINRAETPDVIYGRGEITIPGLPEPDMLPPTRARVEVNPYRIKYEQLINAAKQRQLTPGREYEELQELWSQMAGRTDPGLDELIELAYPSRREITPDLIQRARETQRRREVYGVGMPVRSISDRYQPGPTSPPAMVETKPRIISASDSPRLRQAADNLSNLRRTQAQTEPREEVLASSVQPETTARQTLDDIDYPFTTREVPGAKSAPYSDDIAAAERDLMPDPEVEVSPNIRDYLNRKADQWIEEARQAIRGNRLSSNPIDVYAKFAAGYMLKGTIKLADITEQLVREFGEQVRPLARQIWMKAKDEYKKARHEIEKQSVGLDRVPADFLKKVSLFRLNTTDLYRNFRDVFGRHYDDVRKAVLDPFDEAKKQNVLYQENYLTELYDYVVKDLGIKPNSRLSALVQDYGERKITLDQLKQMTPHWRNVVKADQWFRQAYDQMLQEVNRVREQIYPNNPAKLVPRREDYYHHFRELEGLEGVKSLFESPSQIDPRLEGISEFTKPKSRFASFMQRRGMGPYKRDAVGGFLNYLRAASYAIHIDPQIGVFRTLAKALKEEAAKTKTGNVNDFINYLERFAQHLAGKSAPIDRALLDYIPAARKGMSFINWTSNRLKSNTIVGNLGTVLAQTANIPNGIAFAKQHSIPGMGRTLISILNPDSPVNAAMKKSGFLRERYVDKHYRKFQTDWLSFRNPFHLRRAAEWLLETGDRIGTELIWNSVYVKGLKEGVADPIKYADDHTRKLVAGRGIGEVPLYQKSRIIQTIMPFTLEVGNLWHVMRDFVTARQFGSLAILFVANYLFNRASEQIRGSGVTFDPIEAIIDAISADDPAQVVGRLAGEVVSNVPGGAVIGQIYPRHGKKVDEIFGFDLPFELKLPTRQEFFGEEDPTRFGGGFLPARAMTEPTKYLIPGFGGVQLHKTAGGVKALAEGGSYKGDKLRFPIERTPANVLRAPLFGQYATSEAREYFDQERRPLSERQTEIVRSAPNPAEMYERIMQSRRVNTLRERINEISRDPDLSAKERERQLNRAMREYRDYIERITRENQAQ